MVATTAPAPATRSEAQRIAARLNGAKSRGPATEEGKRRSRRNALKHGLAGGGAVLPFSMIEEVEGKRRPYLVALMPANELGRDLAEQVAVAVVRQRHIVAAISARQEACVRSALEDWDARREAEVLGLDRALVSDPAAVLPRLLGTAEGCDRLADAWQELAEALGRRGRLSRAQLARAFALLGARPTRSDVESIPEAARFGDLYRDLRAEQAEAPGGDAPDGEAPPEAPAPACEALLGFIAGRQAELDARSDDLWGRIDGPDRLGAPARALVDDSPETRRLQRYLADAARQQARALAALDRLKRQAPARDEPGTRSAQARNEPGAARPVPPPPAPMPARNEPGAPAPARVGPVASPPAPARSQARAPVPSRVLDRLEALLAAPARYEPGAPAIAARPPA